jgi:prepilin-type N-terminal cleavage/methylation domain-containing protein
MVSTSLKQSFKNGFTLVELLVVISVIGILAAMLMVNFVGVRERAADAAIKSNFDQLKKALRLYYNDYQRYPNNSGAQIQGCGGAGTTVCNGGTFTAGTTVYMKDLPSDYTYYSDGDQYFLLRGELNNASDEAIEQSQARCATEISAEGITPAAGDYFVCQD